MAQPRFVGGDLHGDRDKPVLVAFQMRPQQRLEVFGTGHRTSPVAMVVLIGCQRNEWRGPQVSVDGSVLVEAKMTSDAPILTP